MKIQQIVLLASVAAVIGSSPVLAQPTTASAPAPAAVEQSSERLSSDSTIGELLANPATKALLIKHFKVIEENQGKEQIMGMSLRMLQSYAPDRIADETIDALDADLAKLPKEAAQGPKSH